VNMIEIAFLVRSVTLLVLRKKISSKGATRHYLQEDMWRIVERLTEKGEIRTDLPGRQYATRTIASGLNQAQTRRQANFAGGGRNCSEGFGATWHIQQDILVLKFRRATNVNATKGHTGQECGFH